MLECVVNVSEACHRAVVEAVVAEVERRVPGSVLDVHSDADHNRTVITLVGEQAPRAATEAALARIDIRDHRGVHPRFGAVDVVPFVPLSGSTLDDAVAARDRFLAWLAREHGVPGFAYGPERTLPDVRRRAFVDLPPDAGPGRPHPSAGATAVGARPLLVAWNVWLTRPDLELARRVAGEIRGPDVRALGLWVAGGAQVSMNLVAPERVGPAEAWDLVASRAPVARAELVGLVPAALLRRTDPRRWAQLDLAEDRTIEHRLADRGG